VNVCECECDHRSVGCIFILFFCFFMCRLWWSAELSGQNESATAAAESDVVDAANNIKGYGAVHE